MMSVTFLRIGPVNSFDEIKGVTSVTTTPSGPVDEFNWDTIELTPDLPLSVFTSMESWHHERIGALALYCSDGRWGEIGRAHV